jgi:hypothetical protein
MTTPTFEAVVKEMEARRATLSPRERLNLQVYKDYMAGKLTLTEALTKVRGPS